MGSLASFSIFTNAFAPPLTLTSDRLFPSRPSLHHCRKRADLSTWQPTPESRQEKPARRRASPNHSREMPAMSTNLSRRALLTIVNGLLGLGTVGIIVKMSEQWRLISPRGVLREVGLWPGRRRPNDDAIAAENNGGRRAEALEYVRKIREGGRDIRCPEFPRGEMWVNSGPLTLGQLRGKVVLLDFWAYCCVNCMHVLPWLEGLEQRYGRDGRGGVAVVGVHSGKFTAERDGTNVVKAVERYGIKHPVVNDKELKMWNEIGVTGWPTLVLVDPNGMLVATWSGEGNRDDIEMVISATLDVYGDEIDRTPLRITRQTSRPFRAKQLSPFSYPGKLTVDKRTGLLYVSDTSNNRVVEVGDSGKKVLRVFGSGTEALEDGAAESAAFNHPQGVVVDDSYLYVADTDNHAVRRVDLGTGKVETIGGNGQQGFDYQGGKAGIEQVMSSPWDLEVVGDTLYVAMAGIHQIWSTNIKSGKSFRWHVFSGSGRELEKNSSTARTAAWAQPSGISAGKSSRSAVRDVLYVADSESSTIRSVDLAGGPTNTLVGGDGLFAENLFAFGDKDGRGSSAKLQHPLAVVYDSSRNILFVADSYNNRIKTVDPSLSTSRAFVGSGNPGLIDGKKAMASFWEPGGLALSADNSLLYVADTNNSAIRVVDIDRAEVGTLSLSSSEQVEPKESAQLIQNRRRTIFVNVDSAVGPSSTLLISLKLPDSVQFTKGVDSLYQLNSVSSTGKRARLDGGKTMQGNREGRVELDLKGIVNASERLELETITFYCDADGVCRMEGVVFQFPALEKEVGGSIHINHDIAIRRQKARST